MKTFKQAITAETKNGLASLSLYNVAFTVTNLDDSINWYRDKLNFELISKTQFTIGSGSAQVGLLEGAGILLELLQAPEQQRIEALFAEVPAHLIPIGNKSIVFQVTDLAEATRALGERGVEFLWKEQYLAGDQMLCSMIQDIDGNKINIFQADTVPQRN